MKKSIVKKVLAVGAIGVLIAVVVVLYMFNQPHRDVQSQASDFSYSVSTIVNEYLTDPQKANEKYLDAEGNSKILEIKGTVSNISTDFNDQKVILLKGENDKAGVSCTLTKETEDSAKDVKIGQEITVKGVIRSGASYDEDLELYEDVIIEKSKVVKQ